MQRCVKHNQYTKMHVEGGPRTILSTSYKSNAKKLSFYGESEAAKLVF